MPAPNEKANPATILIVDDNAANLIALEAVLNEYKVISADSGPAAIEILKLTQVSVILLDIQMPSMDGYETARRIKELKNHRDTPIIFVTAVFKEDPYIKQGYEAGGIDFFTKPFDPDILKMKVGIYASYQQRDELLKEREERIKHSEELLKAGYKLSAVLESLPVGVIISDVKGGILQINEPVLKICQAIEPSLNDSYGEFLKWWPEGGVEIKNSFMQALQTGKSSHNEIIKMRCFNGTFKAILISVSPLLGKGHRIVGAVAVLQDVTEHKKIEAHLEESIMKLVSIGVEFEQPL